MPPRFADVNSRLNFPELEERILEHWRKTDAFRQSVERRKDAKPFVFLEGPPTANGLPGVHHVFTRVMKDVVCRYQTMTGHYVERKAGWDTHGLPVEIEVERALGLDGKKQIEAYGIREFVEKCKESVFRYEAEWRRTTERIGFWVDMDDPYVTLQNDYIESVWSVLKRFWDADLLYQGHKVVPYCPRCGTALSSHEVAQGYQEIEEPSIYVKMRLKDEPHTHFLVWTTTPWTLPSNVALAVHPGAEYVRVRSEEETLILAKDLAPRVLENFTHNEVTDTLVGRDLVGMEYEPLFDFAQPTDKAYVVVEADFVTMEDGTGIVHIAPAFGQDDYEIGQKHGLAFLQLVDLDGKFVDAVEPWAGLFVKEADPKIIEALKASGHFCKEEPYKHDYPFCWRCDTPLLYYARSSWFIRTTAYKNRMVELNRQVNWQPDHIKEGRFGDWLENNVDWAISRERYWGTPIPIWRCDGCAHAVCIGSGEELRRLGRNVPPDLEFHRPYIDAVELNCPECESTMRRIPEVADAWLDSGCAHTAQWHAPFENEEHRKTSYPADFISEAIDQTRGWFYSLLATGAFLYDDVAYRNCLCLEMVLGHDGQKMSKSRGNAVDPWGVLDTHGADAIRWYFYTVAPPWQRRTFSQEAVGEAVKKFLGTLYNIYAFFVLYANAEGIDPTDDVPPIADRPQIDRWIVSRFHSLVRKVRIEMDAYEIMQAARPIESFVEDLSNWYVRRCRDRFWGSANETDTRAAFGTLYEVLLGLSKLLAPFTPFLAEEMYQNLSRSMDAKSAESVHFHDLPIADTSLIDDDLEAAMRVARRIATMGRAARNESGLRVRQPLSRLVVGGFDAPQRDALSDLIETLKDELNVREVEWADTLADFAEYTVKANFRTLGPKFGKAVPAIAKALEQADGTTLQRTLASGGEARVSTDVGTFTLDAEDVQVSRESRDGFQVIAEEDLFVALDTTLTDDLLTEGLARELVNRIQALRKEADFHVADRISLHVSGGVAVLEAFAAHRDYVMGETLAVREDREPNAGATVKEVKIGDEAVTIAVEKASS